MTTLISYKNDPKLKEMLLEEIKKHRKQDQIVQGTYGRVEDGTWKGCAVGCAIHSLNEKLGKEYDTKDHTVYEQELGIPEWLARLEDTIFEGLPVDYAIEWPEQFIEAIPVGVNLEPVKWHFCAFLMKENIETVLELDIEDSLKEEVVSAIKQVLAVHENAIKTGEWDESIAARSAWSAAESARSAWSAAESARSAWSAAESARSAESAELAARSAWSAWSAWSASRSARLAALSARSAESAAESASRSAWSAALSAALSAESKRKYIEYADTLLSLLKNTTQ